MKRSLLLSTLALIASLSLAQTTTYHADFYFDKMSPNGKWMSGHSLGTILLYNANSGEYEEYIASEDLVAEYYATGIGNCWSNDGILVGAVNDHDCAYYNGEWNELPILPENGALNMAHGITPDGSRIVGVVGMSGMNMNSEQMIKPVYWDRDADGSYGLYQELPYPATDFCGRVPQYVTAIAVSDDGKTVVGQIVDWSGFYIYPIVYTQDAGGEWSYRTYCEGILYPEGAVFNEWPGEEPAAPDYTVYMNEDQKAAYITALNEYNDAFNRYLNGEIGWNQVPAEPNPANYIDSDRIDEYNKAVSDYELAIYNYYKEVEEFDAVLMANMNGGSFLFNNVYVSGNGRYYSCTLKHTDYTIPTVPISTNTPVKIDLQEAADVIQMVNTNRDMIASSVMNDGRMIVQNPVMAYGRNSYMVSEDGQTLTAFIDYLENRDSKVAEWVRSKTTFDILYYDENYDLVVAEDSVAVGSVHCNAEGTVFGSFMYDEWSENARVVQFSYVIDFTTDASVEGVKNERNGMAAYVADNALYVQGDVQNVALYDLRGGCVMESKNPGSALSLDVPQGVYVVRLTNDREVYTTKVVVK